MVMNATEIGTRLYEIDTKIDELKKEKTRLEQELLAEMPEKVLTIPGLVRFERHKKADRKAWQHDDIRGALIRKIRAGEARYVDPATREIVPEDQLATTVRVMNDCAHVDYWRVGKLAEYGINAGDYCETNWGREVIEIIPLDGAL
jgi:hypothetical protein